MKKSISTLKRIGVSLLVMTAIFGSAYTTTSAATATSNAKSMVNTNYSTQVNQNTSYRLTVDGVDKTSAVNFVAQGDRSMIGLRDFAGVLGCTVDWDNEKVAIVTKGSTTLEVPIGSPNILVNGQQKAIDQQGTISIIVNSKTYLPFRVIAESLGYTVSYDNETKTIQVTSGSSTQPTPTPQPTPQPSGQKPEKYDPSSKTYDVSVTKGFTLNNPPAADSPLRGQFDRYVSEYRKMGWTDKEINDTIQYVYLCPTGPGYTELDYKDHEQAVDTATNHLEPEPNFKGERNGQIHGHYVWDGTAWHYSSAILSGIALLK